MNSLYLTRPRSLLEISHTICRSVSRSQWYECCCFAILGCYELEIKHKYSYHEEENKYFCCPTLFRDCPATSLTTPQCVFVLCSEVGIAAAIFLHLSDSILKPITWSHGDPRTPYSLAAPNTMTVQFWDPFKSRPHHVKEFVKFRWPPSPMSFILSAAWKLPKQASPKNGCFALHV